MNGKITLLPALALAGALVVGATGCSGSSSSPTSADGSSDAAQETQPAQEQSDSTVSVTIDGAQKATDYEGKPCVIVNYTFTNVSDEEAQAFDTAVYAEVYQDGVQCDLAVCDAADSGSALTKVKAGSSVAVQMAYSISSDSDVEVSVYPIVNLSNTTLARQTFSLA